MSDKGENMQIPSASDQAAREARGGFLSSIVDIFVDPFKVFSRIEAGLTWWKPFVLVCVVMMILSYLTLPLHGKLMELRMQGVSEDQAQEAAAAYGRWAPLGLIMVPIGFLVIYLITAGILHLVINIMSSRSSFKKTLSLISFCGIIGIVEQIIGTIVIKMRGPESIESAEDLKFSLSLSPLAGESKGLLAAVLQSLSIFQIWYYIVLVLGIAAIFKISRKAAVIPVLPIWIISVLLIWMGGTFGGMAMG